MTRKERVGIVSVDSLSFLLQSKTELKPETRPDEKGGGKAKQKQERILIIFFLDVAYKKMKLRSEKKSLGGTGKGKW